MIQETDIETIIGVEIEVETEVEIEAEIEETVEIIVETEEDPTQKVETTNRDLVQVKDTLIKRISETTAIEQIIQYIDVSNYLKRQGKRIVLHNDDDVQEIAQAVQDLNTKLNSLKLSNSTNN